MNTSLEAIMSQTKRAFQGNWQSVALGTFLCSLYTFIALILLLGWSVWIIWHKTGMDLNEDWVWHLVILWIGICITGPFSAGYVKFLVKIIKHNHSDFPLLMSGFKNVDKTFLIGLYSSGFLVLSMVLCVFLVLVSNAISPTLATNPLFRIILTICMSWFIVMIQLRVTWIPYFIYREHGNTMSAWAIVKASWHLMEGNEVSLFLLHLRFIGWNLIAILTLGIGYFWVHPYIIGSIYYFYQDIKTSCGESQFAQILQGRRIIREVSYKEWSSDKIFTIGFIIIFWSCMIGLAFS